ncbi:MAG: HD domain-containing phosphohydrolase [Desulfuromonadales bacterium]
MLRSTKLEMVYEMIRNLAAALSTAALYSPDHPQVMEHYARLTDSFHSLLSKDAELLLALVDGELLYLGKPLAKTANVERLLRYGTEQKVGYIRFAKGFSTVELQQLVKVLLGKAQFDSLQQMTSEIEVGSVDISAEHARPIASFEDMTDEEKQGMQNQFDRVADQQELEVEKISSVIAGFIEAFRQHANPLLALVPIRMQDEYTFTHSVDVGILNIAQGMALGIEGQMLHDIGMAGMLHDVGKIFVDREILNKPGKLDDQEFAMIKEHPSRGAQYLMNQAGIPRLALFSAYEHHMRYDLKGYPQPPQGWQLNICSQMTMISDTFDALRSSRVYDDSWDFSRASGLMLQLAGEQLNPDLTINFLRTLANMGEDIESFGDSREQEEIKLEIIGCSCALANPRCG